MNTNILNTIAVRRPAKGVIRYVVTIATRTSAQAYPCKSMATALKLAERVVTALVTPKTPAAAH